MTVSVGVAQSPTHARDPRELYSTADRALYGQPRRPRPRRRGHDHPDGPAQRSVIWRDSSPARERRSSVVSGSVTARAAVSRWSSSAAGPVSRSPARRPGRPHRDDEAVRPERPVVLVALPQGQLLGRPQPGQRVQQLLLGLGPHPAPVRAVHGRPAPAGRAQALEPDGRDDRLVGLLQAGHRGGVGAGALEPEAEVRGGRSPRARRRGPAASCSRGPGRALGTDRARVDRAARRCASRAAARAVPRSRLTSSEEVASCTPTDHLAAGPHQRRRAAGQDAGQGRRRAIGGGQHGGGRRDQLPQGDPVHLAGQALEGPGDRRGVGRPVAVLVLAARAARARRLGVSAPPAGAAGEERDGAWMRCGPCPAPYAERRA